MSASSPAPGWYPDPAGGGSRWWDGRAWTGYRGAASAMPVVQPPLPDGVSTRTPWIVLQALVPLAQVLVQIPYLLSFRSLFASQVELMKRFPDASTLPPGAARAVVSQFGGTFAAFGVTFALSIGIMAAWVVLASLDARRLERIGIVQPFHWAWSFLGLVYPIGRAVVVQRRTRTGLGPLWLLIGVSLGSMVLGFAVEAAVMLPLFSSFASIPSAVASCGCR